MLTLHRKIFILVLSSIISLAHLSSARSQTTLIVVEREESVEWVKQVVGEQAEVGLVDHKTANPIPLLRRLSSNLGASMVLISDRRIDDPISATWRWRLQHQGVHCRFIPNSVRQHGHSDQLHFLEALAPILLACPELDHAAIDAKIKKIIDDLRSRPRPSTLASF